VTCGITHGISTIADLFVDPGDVILLPEMMWGNYRMVFSVRKHADIVCYNTFTAEGGFDTASLAQAARRVGAEKGKLIVILNFPHNPSGYAITPAEASRIADTLTGLAEAGTRVIAVMDDSYFGLFYEEEAMKESLFTLLCDRHPNLLAVKLDGATKEEYVWGLRVGFITYGCAMGETAASAYTAMEKKTAGGIRGNISNASRLSQAIVLASLQSGSHAAEKQAKYDIMQRRARQVKAVLADDKYNDAWEVYPFNAGYFMCLRLKNTDAETLRVHLLDNYGIGLISLGERDLRVAFSCLEEEQIQELFDTIYRGIQDLK